VRFIKRANWVDESIAVADEVHAARVGPRLVVQWYDVARKEGVTEKACKTVASAFAYPGFRLEAPSFLPFQIVK
jgi:hypothetical protein